MQTWFIASCPVLLTLFASFGHAEGALPGFEEQAQGAWASADQIPNRLLNRLVVSKDDKGWWVEVWAVRGLKEEAVQKAPLHLLRDGVGGKGPVVRGLTTWKEGVGDGEATMYATLRAGEGRLELELSKVYATGKYPNWFASYRLTKVKS
jgi:hypothetical protein